MTMSPTYPNRPALEKEGAGHALERMPLAISHGDTPRSATDVPATLSAMLQRAAGQATDTGIIYIQPDQIETFQSYAALWARARRIVTGLRELGLKPQDKVIFQFEDQQNFIAAFWGCVLGGFVPVPIAPAPSYRDLNSAVHKLHNVWQMLDHPLILTDPTLAPALRALPDLLAIDNIRVEAVDDLLDQSPTETWHESQSDDLALLMLTSGSTGLPKAVMLSHANLISRSAASAQMNGFSSREITLNWMPLDHVAGLIYFHLRDVFLGCRQIHAPSELVLQAPLTWLDWVDRFRVTVTFAPNFGYGLVNDYAAEISRRRWDLSCLRVALNGGEAIVPHTARQFLQLLQPHGLPPTAMCPAWGMSETSSGVTYAHNFSVETATDDDRFVEVGRPIPGCSLRIVDGQDQLVEEGAVGRLQVKGTTVTSGYYGQSDVTQEVFTADGWFNTGDLGLIRAGRLTITGREKDVIIINGINYYSHDIEGIIEEIEGVAVSYTAACAVRPAGVASDQLAIFFNPLSTDEAHLAQLIGQIRAQVVNRVGLNPSYIIPVEKQAIPKTAIGKIQRSHLSQRFEAGDFETALGQMADLGDPLRTFVPPRTPTETTLAQIWANVLNIEQIGINDNFFDLSGQSVLAGQIIARLQEAYDINVPLRHLFEAPTIAELAATLEKIVSSKSKFQQKEESMSQSQTKPASKSSTATEELIAPTSFAQQRLWVIEQFLGEAGHTYNIPMTIRFEGQLDVDTLRQVLEEIIRRHATLRTTFRAEDGQPVQVIAPELSLDVPLIDLSEHPPAKREAETERLLLEAAQHSFNLERGPLLHSKLLRLAPERHILALTMHHIISDGWSVGVLQRELHSLYEAFSQGHASPLPPLPTQYAEFAAWQQNHLRGKTLERQLRYWRKQLGDAPPPLELPTDHPRPPTQTYNGRRYDLTIPTATVAALKALSQEMKASLFMSLLAAFKTLLYRYTGQTDLLVGTPIANRNRTEIEPLIGFFVNTLVLRTDLSGNPTFRDLLKQVWGVCLDAYSYQDVPFEKLVAELQDERDLSRSPFFQVTLALQNASTSVVELPNLKLYFDITHNGTAKFDLLLNLQETEAGLEGYFVYNSDLFDEATIERLAGHYQTLLAGIVADPDRPISQLPLLTEAEQQTLAAWNATQTDYPRDTPIHRLFEAQAAQSPETTALIFDETQLTYADLNRQANQLAHHLQATGIQPGDLVALCLERSVEMIVGLLAILKAGAAYVPLDPAYPAERLAFMLADTQAPLLLTHSGLLDQLPAHTGQTVCVDTDRPHIEQHSIEKLSAEVTAQDLACVMYTSGSTGQPKGVCITQRNVVRLVKNSNFARLDADELFLQFAPISFDAAILEIWGPLLNGGRLVIFPDQTPSLETLGQVIEQQQITTLWLTAGLFHQMVDHHLDSLRGLRQLLAGGDVLSVPHIQKVLTELPNTRLINGYGPTENTTFTTCYPMSADTRLGAAVPIGQPIANTQVYILDAHMQPVPIGVPGELYTGGDGVARGYLNRPELTAERFIDIPATLHNSQLTTDNSQLYKSGDLARWLPDGTIEFLGRIDNQVKLRGFRIELGEIETILSQHPAVEKCVVIAREDTPGDKRLVAYVVEKPTADSEQRVADSRQPIADSTTPSADHSQDESPITNYQLLITDLRQHVKSKLPDYMVPSAFVRLEGLPLNPNGKVDRGALPVPEMTRSDLETTFVAPNGPVEEMLAEVWQEVLGIETVGVDDNFFQLGGHSLLATQVVSRLRQGYDIDLSLRTMFESPTIAELAAAIETMLMDEMDEMDEMENDGNSR